MNSEGITLFLHDNTAAGGRVALDFGLLIRIGIYDGWKNHRHLPRVGLFARRRDLAEENFVTGWVGVYTLR